MDIPVHRSAFVEAAFANFKPVEPWEVPFLEAETKEDATVSLASYMILDVACKILEHEAGRYPDQATRDLAGIRLLDWTSDGKELVFSQAIDYVLEGLPGSRTFRPPN